MSEVVKSYVMGTAEVTIQVEPAKYVATVGTHMGKGTKYSSKYFDTPEEAERWAEKQVKASGCLEEPKGVTEPE